MIVSSNFIVNVPPLSASCINGTLTIDTIGIEKIIHPSQFDEVSRVLCDAEYRFQQRFKGKQLTVNTKYEVQSMLESLHQYLLSISPEYAIWVDDYERTH